MRRRRFIKLIGGGILAVPFAAHSQQRATRRIGCLISGSPASHGPFLTAFLESLRALGYTEGRDFVVDIRWTEGRVERLPPLAEQLAALKPDVVVTAIAAAALAAKHVMPTTPIVSATLSSDPVGVGLVASLNRPGGNVTGILFTVEGLYGKQMQLAREIKPSTRKIGLMVNMRNPDGTMQRGDAETQAAALGISLLPVDVLSPENVGAGLEQMTRENCDFALILSDAIFVTERHRLATIALQSSMPTVFGLREFPIAGGLASYGIDLRENWRRAAYFVDRIFKGEKPADLPVEQPSKFETVINLKTAQALGLIPPPMLLARADEVIE
jgi:putative tryptophan/tyrosine transport system substrate-binding protein